VPLGVFHELPVSPEVSNTTEVLLRALGDIHRRGWIPGQRLRRNGERVHTNAPNSGGYTLESVLGVEANSFAGPDYLGWEVKSLTVKALGSVPVSKRLTLMTPEPRGGVYSDEGVLAFVRQYGYPDARGVPDRLNFGGQYRYGKRADRTGLTLTMDGYESDDSGLDGRIVDPAGAIALKDDSGDVAARWAFSDLIDHWNRKHALAVYVPAESRVTDRRYFHFDRNVFLGRQTDFLRFLGAIRIGKIVYDPGIKVEDNSGPRPRVKRRSQFRMVFGDLETLYAEFVATSVI